jgi:hypothetical protein
VGRDFYRKETTEKRRKGKSHREKVDEGNYLNMSTSFQLRADLFFFLIPHLTIKFPACMACEYDVVLDFFILRWSHGTHDVESPEKTFSNVWRLE